MKVKAHIHSLNGELDEVTIVKEVNANNVVAEYMGEFYTAVHNAFNGDYYVDNIYGLIQYNGDDTANRTEPDTFEPSDVYGVEIDPITAGIAKQLYPCSHIVNSGFENTEFEDNTFDAVLTNVPFGDYHVMDRAYQQHDFNIHDYFLAKSIDKIRPGGIVAVIATKGVMDKANTATREYIAERAELLAAIRLPNTAFKIYAGTEVTADILFFQKRQEPAQQPADSWIEIASTEEGVPVNKQVFYGTPGNAAWKNGTGKKYVRPR